MKKLLIAFLGAATLITTTCSVCRQCRTTPPRSVKRPALPSKLMITWRMRVASQ